MDTRMKFLEHELAAQERDIAAKQEKTAAATAAAEAPKTAEVKEDLELRVRELEAMVKGLTSEMLDLKSVCRRLSTQIEKLGGAPVKSHPENATRFGVRRPTPEAETENKPAETVITRGGAQTQRGRIQPSVPQAPVQESPVVRRRPAPTAASAPAAAPAAFEEQPRRVISSPIPAPEPQRQQPEYDDVSTENLKPGEFEYVMQPDGSIQKRRKTTAGNVIIAGTGFNPGHASRSSAIRADSNAVIEADEDDTVEIK